jgi:DNA (cytosine-5)-methyltransferase 1
MGTMLEFFAGGGMARAGLGAEWTCLFANDIDPMKGRAYSGNFGQDHLLVRDVAKIALADMPAETADLAWASFPCQDLSLAGEGKGLGADTRSGTLWHFFRLMRGLKDAGRSPRMIVLENVVGWLTSRGGEDFAAVAATLSKLGYRLGATVIDAELFVPQSRERVFVIAVRRGETIPNSLIADSPQGGWHPAALVRAFTCMTAETKRDWAWWHLSKPAPRTNVFADLIEETPTGISWHDTAETAHIVGLMQPVHLAKVAEAKRAGRRMVGTLYRRTRL